MRIDFRKLLREFEPARLEREAERAFYSRLRDRFATVVRRAAMAETRAVGKMDRHQRRVGRKTLTKFADALGQVLRALEKAGSFEELHRIIGASKVEANR